MKKISSFFKSMRRSLSLLLAIVFVILIFRFTPTLVVFATQVKAAQEAASIIEYLGNENTIYCSEYIQLSEEEQKLIQYSVDSLITAISNSPELPQAYLTLGRAYCLLGYPEKSIPYYSEYIKRRESNPLGHLELAFAYLAACQQEAPISVESNSNAINYNDCIEHNYNELIHQEFQKAGINLNEFIRMADQAFFEQDYHAAANWYEVGISKEQKQNPSLMFKYNLASVMIGKEIPFPIERGVTIYTLTDKLVIEGKNLYWLREDSTWNVHFGDRLIDHPSSDPNVGVMWWRGIAIAVVDVPKQHTYQITLRVKDTYPGPIRVQLESDFVAINQFVLDEGNETWKELSSIFDLEAGRHIIGIRLLEDTGDAVIERIEFGIRQ